MSRKESFSLKSDGNSKQETEKLFQMLEVKLGEERVVWHKAKSQIRVFRAASYIFLVLLITGALAAFYFIYMRAQEQRINRPEPTTLSDQ